MPKKCDNMQYVACNLRSPDDDCHRVGQLCVYPRAGDENQTAEVSTSNSSDLLSAKTAAISAMGELAQEFRRLGVYHYEEMVRGQQSAICGAVITVEEALSRST